MIFKINPVILKPTKGNIRLVSPLVYRKRKAYVSIRGAVEGEPPVSRAGHRPNYQRRQLEKSLTHHQPI